MHLSESVRTTVRAAQIAGVLGAAVYVSLVQWAVHLHDGELWRALVYIPAIVIIGVLLILHETRDDKPWLRQLLLLGFALHAAGAVARYLMAFAWYDGFSDAAGYHEHGTRLAGSYRAGDFGADIGFEFVGTGFIRVLTGAVYTVTGPSIYIGYAFYAFLGFWGMYFFFRAFETAVPDGRRGRYAALVLLLPSSLFWASGLGKDAWMTFGLGLAALGMARVLAGQKRWVIPVLVGISSTAVVRPPITAALVTAFAVGFVVGRSPHPGKPVQPARRFLGTAAITGIGLLVLSRAEEFLGIKELDVGSVQDATQRTNKNSSTGGSEFAAQPVDSVADLPWAVITTVFRPFPFEASGLPALLAAAEGMVLLALVVLSLRIIAAASRHLISMPYLALCVVFVVVFAYGYSNIGNFGILTRQRIQLLPFFLVLLALPTLRVTRRAMPWHGTSVHAFRDGGRS